MNKNTKFRSSRKKQSGQSLTEYLILVALIAISSIGIIRILGQTTKAQLANITNALQGGHKTNIEAENVEAKHYNKSDLSNFMSNSSNKND